MHYKQVSISPCDIPRITIPDTNQQYKVTLKYFLIDWVEKLNERYTSGIRSHPGCTLATVDIDGYFVYSNSVNIKYSFRRTKWAVISNYTSYNRIFNNTGPLLPVGYMGLARYKKRTKRWYLLSEEIIKRKFI